MKCHLFLLQIPTVTHCWSDSVAALNNKNLPVVLTDVCNWWTWEDFHFTPTTHTWKHLSIDLEAPIVDGAENSDEVTGALSTENKTKQEKVYRIFTVCNDFIWQQTEKNIESI